MSARHHPLPKVWLMTDPRLGDLAAAIARLPPRSGIVFRHYQLPPRERRAIFEQVRVLARLGRHTLILADTPLRAWQWRADGAHDRSLRSSRGLRTMAVHSHREVAMAKRKRVNLLFASPVYATRSHVGAPVLGAVRLGLLVGKQRSGTIALGGMTPARARSLRMIGIHGWAGIDTFRT